MDLSARNVDLRLAIIAAISVLVSISACIVGLIGGMPSGVSTVVVLVGVSISLRVAWSYAAKSASSPSRMKTMQVISNMGLAIAVLTLVASLPRITQAAGIQRFLVDMCAQLWTMTIMMVVTNPVRTLSWRASAGTALAGFLAMTGLARFVGRPMIEHFGTSSVFAVAVWVPLTEEFVKLIPVAIILALALRRSDSRPSAVDAMLIGAWTGAGFALYEGATLGRGSFSLFTNWMTSLIFPSQGAGRAFGWTVIQSGHLIHTALIALAVAFVAFYGRKMRRSWLVPVVVIACVLLEHCSQNAIVANGLNEVVAKIAIALTLGGRMSALLLVTAVAFTVVLELRIVKGSVCIANWVQLEPAEATRRSALLARAQTEHAA